MPYSIGNSQLQVVKGDTNQALQAIGQAYGAVNDSYDKLARLPGMAKAMVQDDADARYTAALNKYSNDPNGLAQALANGEIDTSNVRAETLAKTQNIAKDIGTNHSFNYIFDRTKARNDFHDKNSALYLKAAEAAHNGDKAGYAAALAALPEGVTSDVMFDYANLDAGSANRDERRLGIAGAGLNLQAQAYRDAIESRMGLLPLIENALTVGAIKDPNRQREARLQFLNSPEGRKAMASGALSSAGFDTLSNYLGISLYNPTQAGYAYKQNPLPNYNTALNQANTTVGQDRFNNIIGAGDWTFAGVIPGYTVGK